MFSIFIRNGLARNTVGTVCRISVFAVELYTFSVSNFFFLPSSAPTPPFSNLTRENDMLISAPPLLGHSQVSRLETSQKNEDSTFQLQGSVTQPSITLTPCLNNDSHLSESGRWCLINTPLTCPELHLAYNNIDHSPPRCCFSLLHEITGTLFPPSLPLEFTRLSCLERGRRSCWLGLGRMKQPGKRRMPSGVERTHLDSLTVGHQLLGVVPCSGKPRIQCGRV